MSFSQFSEIVIDLAAGEETRRSLSGTFLRVISATSDFDLGISDQGFISGFAGLGIAADIDPLTGERSRFSELHFRETKGAPNQIRIIHGDGQVFDDRVVFGGTSVPVVFDGAQPVTQDGVWNVGVTGLPAISFDGAQPVAQNGVWNVGVTGLPAISFDGAQPVAQNGVWNVGVTGLPAITFAAPQPVTQSGVWKNPAATVCLTGGNIAITPGASIQMSGVNGGRTRAVIENLGTETLWIRSDNIVSSNGLPVAAGEKVEIFTQQAIHVANPTGVTVPVCFHQEYFT